MKVRVDPWTCQSHMQCVGVTPEIFSYDDEHSHAEAIDGELPTALEARARQAVSLCPERAISIEE